MSSDQVKWLCYGFLVGGLFVNFVWSTRANKPPKNWWQYHTRDCGTKYRGCSPDCPKNIYEETGEWKG